MFNVGDRVEVVKITNGAPDETLGETGIIVESPYPVTKSWNCVQFTGKIQEITGDDIWYYSDEELELTIR